MVPFCDYLGMLFVHNIFVHSNIHLLRIQEDQLVQLFTMFAKSFAYSPLDKILHIHNA